MLNLKEEVNQVRAAENGGYVSDLCQILIFQSLQHFFPALRKEWSGDMSMYNPYCC